MKIHYMLVGWAALAIFCALVTMYRERKAEKVQREQSEEPSSSVTLSQVLLQARACRARVSHNTLRFVGRSERGLEQKMSVLRKLNRRFSSLQAKNLNY